MPLPYFWPCLPFEEQNKSKKGKIEQFDCLIRKLKEFYKNYISYDFFLNSVIFVNFKCKEAIFFDILLKFRYRPTRTYATWLQVAPKNLKKFRGTQKILGNSFLKFEHR